MDLDKLNQDQLKSMLSNPKLMQNMLQDVNQNNKEKKPFNIKQYTIDTGRKEIYNIFYSLLNIINPYSISKFISSKFNILNPLAIFILLFGFVFEFLTVSQDRPIKFSHLIKMIWGIIQNNNKILSNDEKPIYNLYFSLCFFIILILISVIMCAVLKIAHIKLTEKIESLNVITSSSPIEFIEPNNWTLNRYYRFLQNDIILNNKIKNELLHMASHMYTSRYLGLRSTGIFTGPPGVGKTESAKALISYIGGGYIIKISNLLLLPQKEIDQLFAAMIRLMKKDKFVLLFDDGELGLIDRYINLHSDHKNKPEIKKKKISTQDQEYKKKVQIIVNNLLYILGDNDSYAIFTTNINDIDPAYSRRFSFMLKFQNPDFHSRAHIIYNLINKYKKELGFLLKYDNILHKLSEVTDSISGRSLAYIFKELAIQESYRSLTIEYIIEFILSYKKNIDIRLGEDVSEKHMNWTYNNVNSDNLVHLL